MKILVIEDEEDVGLFVKKGLESELFVVDIVNDGRLGMQQALSEAYDLIILDIHLPGVNGFDVAENLRENDITTPIIVLTVDSSLETKLQMLAFCDDYVLKPFSLDELIARIRAVTRRSREGIGFNDVLEVGGIKMDLAKCEVSRDGKVISLRRKEFSLLEYLMRNPGIVLSRGEILNKVWGLGVDPFTNTVDVHIRFLRKKIDDNYDYKTIRTVPGRGYKIEA